MISNFIKAGIAGFLFLFLFSCGGSGSKGTDVVPADTTGKDLKELNSKILESPDDADLYHARAKKYLGQKDADAALADMGRALKLDSSKGAYYLTLADIYFFGNKSGEAKNALEKCVKKDPSNLDALLKLAELYCYVDKNEESMNYLDKVLKLDVNNAKAYFIKGINFKRMGDTAKAISSLQTAVEQDQQYYSAYIQLGVLCAAQKNRLAVDYYDNALRISPKSTEAMYNKAKFFQDASDYKTAVAMYNELLKIDPQYKFAWYNLGAISLVEKKDYKAALANFNKAIQCDGQYAEAYFARGACYQELGDKKKALEDYRTSLQMDPQYTPAAEAINALNG